MTHAGFPMTVIGASVPVTVAVALARDLMRESLRAAPHQRSSTSMGVREREQHGSNWSLAARSSSVR